jgi:hypothetical protein
MLSRVLLAGVVAVGALVCDAASAVADEYKVEVLDEKAPAELAPAIAARLSPTGIRVIGPKGPYCDLWLAVPWNVKADFKASNSHLYPFVPGDLLGAIRYAGKTPDFRDQQLRKGVYTLRYSLQPQDGNHVGTSDTRDFCVLLRAADDKDAGVMAKEEELYKKAAAAAETTHPAMLSLKRAGEPVKAPAIRHEADHELWIVQATGKTKAGDKAGELPFEIVVVGKAAE